MYRKCVSASKIPQLNWKSVVCRNTLKIELEDHTLPMVGGADN